MPIATILEGKDVSQWVNWEEAQLLARFDNDSVQANIDIDSVRFVNEAAEIIRNAIAAGKMFTGLPLTTTVTDIRGNQQIINLYVKLGEGLKINTPNDISVKVGRIGDILDLGAKLETITFGLLAERQIVTNADYREVLYVVEKEFNFAEFAILALATYMMTREVIDNGVDIAKDAATLVGIAASGVIGPIGAFLFAVLVLVARIVFFVLMINALIDLIKELIDYIYPSEQKAFGMTFNRGCERIFAYFGYTFQSPIPEMEWIYLPSKPEGTTTNKGIPNPQDIGYRAIEWVDMCKQMFNAKLSINNTTKTVTLRSLNDPYWKLNSPYVKPDVLNEERVYNTDDMRSVRMITFLIDPADFYTVEEFQGTAYEVNTKLITEPANKELIYIDGLEEVRIPLSLANRKSGLSDLEKALSDTVGAVNEVVQLFFGKAIKNKVKDRVGLMRVGGKYWYVPKVVVLNGNRIPANYRGLLSAKVLWDKYWKYWSFKPDGSGIAPGQKRVVNDEENPFTLESFLAVADNKFFKLSDGSDGEMTSIQFAFDADIAKLSYKVQETYCKNIDETYIEAS